MIKASDHYIQNLIWPKNSYLIGRLSIEEFQQWYLSQNAEHMVFLGQDPKFKRFIFWNYTIFVKALRLWYKIKRGLVS